MITFNYVNRNETGIHFETKEINEADIKGVEIINDRLLLSRGGFKKWHKKIRVTVCEPTSEAMTRVIKTYTGSYYTSSWAPFKALVKGWESKKSIRVEYKKGVEKRAINWEYARPTETLFK